MLSIIISYLIFISNIQYNPIKPILRFGIIGVALFSFTATTMPHTADQKYTNINKIYTFEKHIGVFVTEFNELQKKEIKQLDKFKIPYDNNIDEGIYTYTTTGETLVCLARLEDDKQDTIFINSFFANYKI